MALATSSVPGSMPDTAASAQWFGYIVICPNQLISHFWRCQDSPLMSLQYILTLEPLVLAALSGMIIVRYKFYMNGYICTRPTCLWRSEWGNCCAHTRAVYLQFRPVNIAPLSSFDREVQAVFIVLMDMLKERVWYTRAKGLKTNTYLSCNWKNSWK